jgi:hypothetical protein
MYIPPWAFYVEPEDEQLNIFYLDKNPEIAARYHCDKHVVKMILETTQILSTVHHRYNSGKAPYKETHKNHPSTLWAGDSYENYVWLHKLGIELCREYSRRYNNKVHKCYWYLSNEVSKPPLDMPHNGFTDPPMCMPDECKTFDNVVEAYHNYYRMVKKDIAVWKYSPKPKFMEEVNGNETSSQESKERQSDKERQAETESDERSAVS